MKRNTTSAILGFLLAAGLSATTLTGVIKYSDGRPVNGVLTLQTSQRVNVLNTGSCTGPTSLVPSGPQKIQIFQGSPPVGTTAIGTDCLSPQFSYYSARLVDSMGNQVFNEFWRFTGASVDIGEILPVVNPGATPLALNGDVTGDVSQSIVQRLQGIPLAATAPVTGQILLFNGTTWLPGSVAGTGTVTSVGETMPAEFTVSGVPITSAGAIAVAWANEAANLVLAGAASGSPGPPSFRALVAADIPSIPESKVINLVTDLAGLTPETRVIATGAGLAGGGDLTADRTLSIPAGGVTDSMLSSAATSANTASTIVKRDGSGNFAAGTITGSLTGNATNVSGVVAIANGGTGQSTKGAGFDALSPMVATGDTIYQSSGGNARLVGNTSATKKLLTETGDGTNANPPTWGVLVAGDIPNIAESQVTGLATDLSNRALTATTVTATAPLTGSGTLGSNLTLGVSPCAGGGSHTSGVAPDPGASPVGNFLRDDCTWQPAAGGGGTVTSVGLNMPAIFSVSGSPVTGSSAFTVSLGTEPANFVWSGPTTGSAAAPTFRLLVAGDIPAIPESGVTGLVSDLAGKASTSTTVTATAPLTGTGTLGSALTLGVNTFSTTQPGVVAASGSASKFIRGDNTAADAVTSVNVTVPAEFAVSGVPFTTTGTAAITKATQTANTVWAGPSSGSAAAPTFRALVPLDIPNIAESQVTNLVSDLAATTPQTRSLVTTAPLRIDGGASANLSADRTFSLNLTGGGCLTAAGGGLGIGTACITDAMLSPSTGFVKRDGSTKLTADWNIGPENLGLNVPTPLYGWHQLGGGMREQAVASPGAPAVTPQGTTGSTNYTYQIVAIDHNGGKTLVGAAGTTSTGNATLTSVNFNHLTWTAVDGASTYDVLINGTSTSVALNISTNFFDDQGGTQAPYTPPARNSTADLTIDGNLSANVVFSGPINVPTSVTTGQFVSTVTTGTAPLVVASTTAVANLTLASDSQLPTISTAGKVSNSATTGTAANTGSTLVLRDGSGNFAAGTITANLTGNASGSAGSFTGSLVGDVTGTQGATVVALVGTSTAANVHAAEVLANAATASNTASQIVKRDGSGNFSAGAPTFAGQITSSLATGTAPLSIASTTAVANLTLAADTQLPTISSAGKVSNSATSGVSSNTPSTLVLRDGSGNFSAGTVTTSSVISNVATGTAPLTVTSTTAVANLTLAADSQLPTISTGGKVANSATTATAANTVSAIVARDGSGNFAAGNVTAAQFIGPVTAIVTGSGAGAVNVSASSAPVAGYSLVATDATHAVWANTVAGGAVPTSRTITTTAPLLIDGGASADLTTNRTLSIAVTPTNPGGAVAYQNMPPATIQNQGLGLQQGVFTTALGVGWCFQATSPSFQLHLDNGSVTDTSCNSATSDLEAIGIDGTPKVSHDEHIPGIALRQYQGGTFAAKTATQSGDYLGNLNFYGYGASHYDADPSAAIVAIATENYTNSNFGAKFSFRTRINGSSGPPTEAMVISNGAVTIPTGSLTVTESTIVTGASSTVIQDPGGIDIAAGPLLMRHGSITLANGANGGVLSPVVNTGYVRIVGPTAAFSIGGISGSSFAPIPLTPLDGQLLFLFNSTSQTMTIKNEDITAGATNRFKTLTGADVVLRTNAPSFASFIYDGVLTRWILMSTN